jgi:adenylate cyclase
MSETTAADTSSGVRCGAVLFTDLVGFTAYTDANGDRAAVEVLDRQMELVESSLTGRGRVVKELGDGLLVWFDAVDDGFAATRELLASFAAVREAASFPLAVRMGLHAGEVIERGDDVAGQTVNVAARVAELAGPGELLVTDRIVGDLPEAVAWFRPVGPVRVKGVTEPVWLHRLVP